MRACRVEGEWGCYIPWKFRDTGIGDTRAVDGEIVCRGELGGCAGDGGAVTDVEVAGCVEF